MKEKAKERDFMVLFMVEIALEVKILRLFTLLKKHLLITINKIWIKIQQVRIAIMGNMLMLLKNSKINDRPYKHLCLNINLSFMIIKT